MEGNIVNSYYPNGKVFESTDPDGNIDSFEYDLYRQRTIVTDSRGNGTTYDYSTDGHQLRVTNPDGSTELNSWGTTANVDQGLLLYQTNAMGVITANKYNNTQLGDLTGTQEYQFQGL